MPDKEELVLEESGRRIEATLYGKSGRGAVLCPPHPEYGGDRRDSRLVSIARRLADNQYAALCLDYSSYSGGIEEVEDVSLALRYMEKTRPRPGLIGYSYGAVVASNAAARYESLSGLVLISPLERVDLLTTDTASPQKRLVIYGKQDPMVASRIDGIFAAFNGEKEILRLETDHFFAGLEERLADACLRFFQATSS
jgi:uncharacterized protein